MDPNETLRLIRQALADDDIMSALESARDLAEWAGKGGFPPADPAWKATLYEVIGRGVVTVERGKT